MLLMSKGSKVVFVAYVHNTDTFNTMSKGSKGLKDYVENQLNIKKVRSKNVYVLCFNIT